MCNLKFLKENFVETRWKESEHSFLKILSAKYVAQMSFSIKKLIHWNNQVNTLMETGSNN